MSRPTIRSSSSARASPDWAWRYDSSSTNYRFCGAGTGRRRGRHVARQQLSGLRLRRAVGAVFVLVRTQSVLDAQLLQPAGDLGLLTALRAALRADTAYPLAPRGAGRRLESRTALLAGQHQPRRVDLRRADHRDRPAVRTEDSESSRAGNVSGKGVPLRALGLRLRPARPAGSGGRHRRVRRPVRPEDPAHGRPARIGCRPPTAPAGRRTR